MVWLLTLLSCTHAPPTAPSVLLVLIDGLRADRVGVYGHLPSETPMIDTIAADGTVFTRAYSTSTDPAAARASIMSGYVPPQHGVRAGNQAHPIQLGGWVEQLGRAGWKVNKHDVSDIEKDSFELNKVVTKSGYMAVLSGEVSLPEGSRKITSRSYDQAVRSLDSSLGLAMSEWRRSNPEGWLVIAGVTGSLVGARPEARVVVTDDLIRVPLIIQGPGVERGWEVADVVSTVDVGSTIMASLGMTFDGPGGVLMNGGVEYAYHESVLAHEWFNARPLVGYTGTDGRYIQGVHDRWYPAMDDSVWAVEDSESEYPEARQRLEALRALYGVNKGLDPEVWTLEVDAAETVGWVSLAVKIRGALASGNPAAARRMFERLEKGAPQAKIVEKIRLEIGESSP